MKRTGAAVCAVALAAASCSGAKSPPKAAPSPTPTTAAPRITNSPTPSPKSHPVIHAPAPRFAYSVSHVTAQALGGSYHAGCPVGPQELRLVTVSFWGFDNHPHTGSFVARVNAYPAIVGALRTLFYDRFPIRLMRPISNYGGDDNASMAVDNTSAFNCRYAVAPGPKHWSEHAYGEAIDINPVENPYQEEGRVLPPNGAPYLKRSPYRAGMIVAGGVVVRAFRNVGWGWGGYFSSPDYQHFSATGN